MGVREGGHGPESLHGSNRHLNPDLQRSSDSSEHAIGQGGRAL